MKNIFIYIVLLWSSFAFSQNEQLAQYYYDKGDFEKAIDEFVSALEKGI